MINWDKFNEYLKFYDDALILEVINMFIHDLPENISTLKEKVEEKDFCKVDIIAHSLKSNFATFGATEPQELALKLEMMGKKKVDVITDDNGAGFTMKELFSQFETASSKVVLELEQYKKTHSS